VTVFDERARLWKIGVSAALLAALCAYHAWWAGSRDQGWRWVNEAPEARDGAPLVFPLWTVTGIDGPDRYRISKVVRDVPVIGASAELEVGATVSVVSRFDASRRVAVEELREIHRWRWAKEALGVLGFAVIAAALPFVFRVRGGRLEERWRI
jgi:hypothetical protein